MKFVKDDVIFQVSTDGYQDRDTTRDMFNSGRRSAISTSELGLYSDHSDQYNASNYSTTVRKSVIGIMVVVSVILIGIFLYDFASSASISSKVSQETKHIYILQNSLRKQQQQSPANRKSSVTLAPTIYIVNSSHATGFEDRADINQNSDFKEETAETPAIETRTQRMAVDEPESRIQNLQNFKIRERMLDRQPDEEELYHDKPMVDNHSMIYRVSRLKLPESDEVDDEGIEEDSQRATPFRYEFKGPQPTSFKRPKYPQLTQYRNPHTSRNIQDIIKYLTNDPEMLNRGIKFTGFYVSPKKYDTSGQTDIGEVAMNSEKLEEQVNPYAVAYNADPLYQYKPKHPADVNLLAPSNFRFSPIGINRYNPYFDPYFQRQHPSKQMLNQEGQYDSVGSFGTTNYGRRKKPKPFSIMLDIYPISDTTDQTKKSSRLKPQIVMDESDARRSVIPYYSRHPKAYGLQAQLPQISPVQTIQHPMTEEEEKHQMILHLNLYPKKKTKVIRNDVIERSEKLPSDEKHELLNRLLVPFHEITKQITAHAATEEATLNDNDETTDSTKVQYEENNLENEKIAPQAERLVNTTTEISRCKDCELKLEITTITQTTNSKDIATTIAPLTTKTTEHSIRKKKQDSSTFKDIDTVEGFQKFADSLIAMD